MRVDDAPRSRSAPPGPRRGPVSQARRRAAATSWSGTWAVEYDDGVGRHQQHLRAGVERRPGPVAEEHLVGDHHPEGLALRAVEQSGTGRRAWRRRGAGQVGHPGHQRAQRCVLAEGHPVDLVVPLDERAVGAEGDLGVAEASRPGVLHHADQQDRLQAAGLLGERRGLGAVGEGARRRSPCSPATAPRRSDPGSMPAAGVEVAHEHVARVGLEGGGAPGPAALHTGHPDRAHPPPGGQQPTGHRGCGHGEHQEEGQAGRRGRRPSSPSAARPGATSARSTPTRHVSRASSTVPPRRTAAVSGLSAWPSAMPPIGNPPHGTRPRRHLGPGHQRRGGHAPPSPRGPPGAGRSARTGGRGAGDGEERGSRSP